MNPRQILIIKGSPRKKGNSAILADKAAEGAVEGGAKVESFYLQGMHIEPCTACDACLKNGGDCIIKDDMQEVYPKLRRADAILFASPIYWFAVSAQTKLFIDRLYALESPQGNALKGKQIGILLTYGDGDPLSSGVMNAIHSFQDMFKYIGADILGVVHGTAGDAGDVLKNPALLESAYKLGQKLGKG